MNPVDLVGFGLLAAFVCVGIFATAKVHEAFNSAIEPDTDPSAAFVVNLARAATVMILWGVIGMLITATAGLPALLLR